MAKVVGDIAIAVGADIGPLKREMGKGSKVVKGFGGDTAAMSRKIAKAGAVVATAAAAMGGALLAAGKKAAAAAVEINNMSRIANAGTVEFQKMASAADTVNISQEKLADILKDVNDRVGDFVTTGGGPMKDFFEQIAPLVGVTADQFARLSGPEALQLYFTSLEKANLSQQEMTFFLEAMASDATALIPLLRNNGSEMKRLGDEAQRTGRILDDELIQNGVKLDKVLTDAADTMSTSMNKALLDNADLIIAISDAISDDLIPAVSSLLGEMNEIISAVSRGAGGIAEFFRIATDTEPDGPGTQTRKDGTFMGPFDDPDEPSSGTGTRLLDENGNPIFDTPSGTGGTGGFGGRGGGGSSKGPTEDDLERLRDQFATEAEIIEENYQTSLEKLEEFRTAKLGTEEEFNQLESRINKDHQDAQVELERRAMDAKLRIARTIFGNLSSLMRTESEKLFKIGKAAAIAGAIVSTHRGIAKALELPFPANLAAAASVAAKGFASVAAIQSQSIGGGGGGGAGAAASGGGAGQVEQSSFFNVNLVGEGNIGRGSVRDLIEQINDEIEDGAVLRGITVN